MLVNSSRFFMILYRLAIHPSLGILTKPTRFSSLRAPIVQHASWLISTVKSGYSPIGQYSDLISCFASSKLNPFQRIRPMPISATLQPRQLPNLFRRHTSRLPVSGYEFGKIILKQKKLPFGELLAKSYFFYSRHRSPTILCR